MKTDRNQTTETLCRLILCAKGDSIRPVLRFHLGVFKQNLLNMKVEQRKFDKSEDYINNKGAKLLYSEPEYFFLQFRQFLTLMIHK